MFSYRTTTGSALLHLNSLLQTDVSPEACVLQVNSVLWCITESLSQTFTWSDCKVLLSHICMFDKLHKYTLHFNWSLLWHHGNSDANKAVVCHPLRSPVSNILHLQPKDFLFTLLLFRLHHYSPVYTITLQFQTQCHHVTTALFNKPFWVQFYHPIRVSVYRYDNFCCITELK